MRSQRCRNLAGVLAFAFTSHAFAAEYCVSADADDADRTHASIAAAIDAAAATEEADRIRVVIGAAEAGQALVVAGHDVTLSGGYDDCSQSEPGESNTTVSAAGTAQGTSVLTIFGPAEVRLEHLDITGGTGLDGAGINFVGGREPDTDGRLELADTRVFGNVAGRDGGGLHVVSYANTFLNNVKLIFEDATRIDGNQALENGGALHLSGTVYFLAAAARLSFGDNEAVQGDGGAIYLRQPATADIASAPWNGEATFLRNSAGGSGGAIHMEAPGDVSLSSRLRLWNIAANRPLAFERNQAGQEGGALRINGSFGPARQMLPGAACGSNVNFIENTAGDGAAMSLAYASYVPCAPPPPPRPAIAPCEPFQACNRLERNRNLSEDARGLITLELGYAFLFRATVVHNQPGSTLFHLVGEQDIARSSDLVLYHTLVADNRLTGDASALIRSQQGANGVEIRYSTLAGNTLDSAVGGAATLDFGAGIDELVLDKNILYQPGTQLLRAGNTPNIHVRDVLLHELPAVFAPSASIITGDPRFAGPGDYQLQNDSPAVDFAPAFTSPTLDLAGKARSLDLPERPNVSGPTDLGAFESQPAPPPQLPAEVFADGFETP